MKKTPKIILACIASLFLLSLTGCPSSVSFVFNSGNQPKVYFENVMSDMDIQAVRLKNTSAEKWYLPSNTSSETFTVTHGTYTLQYSKNNNWENSNYTISVSNGYTYRIKVACDTSLGYCIASLDQLEQY